MYGVENYKSLIVVAQIDPQDNGQLLHPLQPATISAPALSDLLLTQQGQDNARVTGT